MALLEALVIDPFNVDQPLLYSFLLDPQDSFEVWLAIRTDEEPGSGTVTDPYDASALSVFDALMNSFQPYTTIHLGPGLFATSGHADGVGGGWQPRRGQRIVGSGIDVTMLKLTPPLVNAGSAYFAIGADDAALINEFEVSD